MVPCWPAWWAPIFIHGLYLDQGEGDEVGSALLLLLLQGTAFTHESSHQRLWVMEEDVIS